MKKKQLHTRHYFRNVLFLTFIVFLPGIAIAWGFFAHKAINRNAVFTLPAGMIGFYKRNIDYIEKRAVAADRRRYTSKAEAPRHYIDLERYGKNPFDVLPHAWDSAVTMYSKDTLEAYGILPWHLQQMLYRLTEAFKIQDSASILYLSADLGHYVADAHVPLHTTENHNGQLTGQHGIHSFWEARLPELFSSQYNLAAGSASYMDRPRETIWDIIRHTRSLVDSLLQIEKKLTATFPPGRKYSLEKKGKKMVKVYSEEYSKAYHDALGGEVENQMRLAIHAIGCFWYTAWVNAGQPDLNKLVKQETPAEKEEAESKKMLRPRGHED